MSETDELSEDQQSADLADREIIVEKREMEEMEKTEENEQIPTINTSSTLAQPLSTHSKATESHMLHLKDEFRRPSQVLYHFLVKADEILVMHNDVLRQVGLAFVAGMFISIGAVLSLWITLGLRPDLLGISRLLLGFGFSVGFILVVITNSALFTEMNVLLPVFLLSRRSLWKWRVLRLWVLVWAGNLLGMMFMGLMLNAGLMVNDNIVHRLDELFEEKLIWKDLGVAGWFQCMASGVVGNFLIGMAAFLSAAAPDFTGSVVGVLLPTIAFVAIGAQHSPANTAYTCLAFINVAGRQPVSAKLWEMIAWNLCPATLGNLIGGAIMVGGLMFYLHGSALIDVTSFFERTAIATEHGDKSVRIPHITVDR